MNLRYAMGMAWYRATQVLLSRRWFPRFRTFLRGREWPYDVICHLGTRDVRTVLDVGANVGQTALYLRRYFPAAEIHSFEMSPHTAEILRHNTRRFSRIHVHPIALGCSKGTARIRRQAFSELNSLRYASQAEETGVDIEDVTIATLDQFASQHRLDHIDVLKTDAQASDLDVLRGGDELLRNHRVSFIYVEVTFQSDQPDCQAFQPVHDHLTKRGLVLSHFYEQWNSGPVQVFSNALYFDPAGARRRSTE